MRVYTYCYGEHHVLFDIDTPSTQESDRDTCLLGYLDSICSIQEPLKRGHSPQRMLLCSNLDPPKLIHSPQRMLSLIDPTECFAMNRKEGGCYTKAIIRDPDPEVKLYHRAYLQCLEKSTCLKQELQQSKCRDLLCSKQEPLKRAHPTECCIVKRIDGECYTKANFHRLDTNAKLHPMLLSSNLDLPKLVHSPQGMLYCC